jgi:F-type H+-transporting ATPase subunit alpha
LFNSGVRPAVNPGISVSRVGSAAQIKAMKKVSGSLKLLYSQFRELQSFSQFGSDLDKDTKDRLEKGERIVEVLKQDKNSPITVEHQVVIIYAVVNDYLKEIPVKDVQDFQDSLFNYLDTTHPDIVSSINESKDLTKDNEEHLKSALSEYVKKYLNDLK